MRDQNCQRHLLILSLISITWNHRSNGTVLNRPNDSNGTSVVLARVDVPMKLPEPAQKVGCGPWNRLIRATEPVDTALNALPVKEKVSCRI